jgi:hypothetical protein
MNPTRHGLSAALVLLGAACLFARRAASASLAGPAGMGLVVLLLFVSAGRGDEPDERQRKELLDQMRALAEQTGVQFAEGERKPELVKDAALRYADQPRGFIDATLWVWTDQGRPVAFQKIEAARSPTQPPIGSTVSPPCRASCWSPSGRNAGFVPPSRASHFAP